MKHIILAVFSTVFLASVSVAGDFSVTDQDHVSVSVSYTGYVDSLDVVQWNRVVRLAGERVILLTINSPGGSAYGGLDLYWAIEKQPRVVTIAGSEYGAWSAAAIMWLAGDHKLIQPQGAVWFHAAYCQWDPEPPTDIGCDTTSFQKELIKVLCNAGFCGARFNAWLNFVQANHGTDGWIGVTNDGWSIRDTTDRWFKPFKKDWITK